ncbi:MAG: carboxypeptidase-like regulatory domain-containing protein, partial [Bacteroidia bacterium]|nr:carboxypeptidase-like regulatory domain-containing protein [Bacteroidia bacterium]
MKKFYILFSLFFVFTTVAFAQQIKGKVNFIEATGQTAPASFANVWWLEGKEAVETDIDGNFSFKKIKSDDITLIATFIGYTKDTIVVSKGGVSLVDATNLVFNLKSENELESLVVTGRQEGNYLSKTAQIKTEVITAAGLCKMACCSLAESFENS